MDTIGTCSRSGGAVSYPRYWGGTQPAPLVCQGCGASKRNYGPVIDMGLPKEMDDAIDRLVEIIGKGIKKEAHEN